MTNLNGWLVVRRTLRLALSLGGWAIDLTAATMAFILCEDAGLGAGAMALLMPAAFIGSFFLTHCAAAALAAYLVPIEEMSDGLETARLAHARREHRRAVRS